ncbi:hypothetical protein K227x_14280 [Rubripirellula lacrimiformis]|uniref:Uncharacterized protein n=1 Tax=Rubripirellula lacrimiformis TaxID=1930273 RepID=A0A517N7C2_9BACT|nr:hypothetical protein [Rubripirellula lacrimiformis]QDT03049.1 hypothetical protein K227x_14280 [Rubripirellula lacrimiformis]
MAIPISSFQAALLGHGAIVEGYAKRPPGFRKRVVPKDLRSSYENILTAILLYDGGATVAPNIAYSHLTDLADAHELIAPIDVAGSRDFETRIAHAYELGFMSFRRRENRVAEVAPRITHTGLKFPDHSLDDQLADIDDDEHMAQSVELVTDIADSIYGIWQLTHGDEFERSWINHTSAFSDYLGHHESVIESDEDAEESLRDVMSDVLNRLPYHMGLYFDNDRVSQEIIGEPAFFNFDPEEMRDVFQTEDMLSSSKGVFTNHLQQGLALGMRPSPAKFLACHSLWRTVFEFSRMLDFATDNKTELLTSISRLGKQSDARTVATSDEQVGAYQLLSDTLPTVPRVASISELLRLRDDRHLPALRSCVKEWASAMALGDGVACARIAKDVTNAGKAIDRAKQLKTASQTVNYITIPVAVAEALVGTCFGLLLLPVGPCLDLAASRLLSKNSWIQFGGPID